MQFGVDTETSELVINFPVGNVANGWEAVDDSCGFCVEVRDAEVRSAEV